MGAGGGGGWGGGGGGGEPQSRRNGAQFVAKRHINPPQANIT